MNIYYIYIYTEIKEIKTVPVSSCLQQTEVLEAAS